MLKKLMLVLAIFVFVGQIFNFQSTAYSEKKREYILGAHFENTAGLPAIQILDISTTIVELFREKTGTKITINEKFSNHKDVFDAFIKNKIDGMPVWGQYIILLKEKNIEVLPFITYTVDKREKRAYCLWQKKDKVYTKFSDIIGTTLIGPFDSFEDTLNAMLTLRDYLYKSGIDKPLWQIFKSFQKVANSNSAFMALEADKGDFFWITDDNDFSLKLMMPGVYSHLSHKFCTERIFDRWMFVLNKKTMNKEDYRLVVETGKNILSNYEDIFKKNKNLKPYLQMAKTARFAPSLSLSSVPFEEDIKIWEKSKKNGWYEESKFLAEKLLKAENGELVVIKFTYEECKAKCKSAKNQMACVDECMK